MLVTIVTFPETKVATVSHLGSPSLEHDTARKLITWKLQRRLLDQSIYRSYGLHYTNPRTVDPAEHRVDFCLSYDGCIDPNPFGVFGAIIPTTRCALARDIGSRLNNQAAAYLFDKWLPGSKEEMADFPAIFHYVNVGPDVKEHEAITDVYLPLK